MTTVRELIASSLRRITVIGAGENMTADDANDGLVTLNQMISSWSADGTVVYSRSVDTKSLSAGVQTYTMGVGGDINTTRPVSITNATITQGVIVTPLSIWSQNTFSVLQTPSLPQSIPCNLFVNNGNPLLTLQLYPIPFGGLTLTLYSIKPLTTLSLNDVLDLPPGYEKAFRDNLAVELAPEYEREASKTVKDGAYDGLQAIKRNNDQYSQATMSVDPALGVKYTNQGNVWGWGFNIYGGY